MTTTLDPRQRPPRPSRRPRRDSRRPTGSASAASTATSSPHVASAGLRRARPGLAGLRAAAAALRHDRLLAELVRRLPGAAGRDQRDQCWTGWRSSDRVVGALVTTAGLILVACLVGIVVFTAVRGWEALHALELLHRDHGVHRARRPARPGRHLRRDGRHPRAGRDLDGDQRARSASPPRSTSARCAAGWPGSSRIVVEAMSAVPTIVAGLFIYSMLILKFGQERSGFAASLALCVSMIPVVTTTAEVVLRLVPNGLREASLALGTTQWQTVRRVVLPDRAARPRHRRAARRRPRDRRDLAGPAGRRLDQRAQLRPDARPAAVAAAVRLQPDAPAARRQAIARAFGAAVVLLVLVVVLFGLARIIGGREPGHLSRRGSSAGWRPPSRSHHRK